MYENLNNTDLARSMGSILNGGVVPGPVNNTVQPVYVLPIPGVINIFDYWQNAAGPASRQIYIVPAGYRFNCTTLIFTSPNASSNSVTMHDETSDVGNSTRKVLFMCAASASSVYFTSPVPIQFTSGIRVEAGELSGNLWCGLTFVGYLEKISG